MFKEVGADGIVVDAIPSIEEMKTLCQNVSGPICANNLDGGKSPIVKQKELAKIGFALVSYPVTLIMAQIVAMRKVLEEINEDRDDRKPLLPFKELCNVVGLDEYLSTQEKYRTEVVNGG